MLHMNNNSIVDLHVNSVLREILRVGHPPPRPPRIKKVLYNNPEIPTYNIAGKFGGELNLAVWWSILQPPN